MTSYRNSEVGYWLPCNATSLTGAKSVATKYYRQGFRNAVLMIAVGDNVGEQRVIVARRKSGGQWQDD